MVECVSSFNPIAKTTSLIGVVTTDVMMTICDLPFSAKPPWSFYYRVIKDQI